MNRVGVRKTKRASANKKDRFKTTLIPSDLRMMSEGMRVVFLPPPPPPPPVAHQLRRSHSSRVGSQKLGDRLLKLSTFVAPHPLDPQRLHHFPAVAEDDYPEVAHVTKLGPQMHFRICILKRCCDTQWHTFEAPQRTTTSFPA